MIISVTYNKTKHVIDASNMKTVGDLKAHLAELTNVCQVHQKLLYKSRCLTEDDQLDSLNLRKKASMLLIGTQQDVAEDLAQIEKKFEARERNSVKSPKLQNGSHVKQDMLFGCLEPLPEVAGSSMPSSKDAYAILQRLATDPHIYNIMKHHKWKVGVLKEFAPSLETGLVGVTHTCLLGYNRNFGEVIALRLRTDDFKGFRHYHVIIQTLLHELAHMVYGEHDRNFWNLYRQLRKEYDELHWTRSTGHQLVQQHHTRFLGKDSHITYDESDETKSHVAWTPQNGMQVGGGRTMLTASEAATHAALSRAQSKYKKNHETAHSNSHVQSLSVLERRRSKGLRNDDNPVDADNSQLQFPCEVPESSTAFARGDPSKQQSDTGDELSIERRIEVYVNAMMAEEASIGEDPYTYRPRRSVQVGADYQATIPPLETTETVSSPIHRETKIKFDTNTEEEAQKSDTKHPSPTTSTSGYE